MIQEKRKAKRAGIDRNIKIRRINELLKPDEVDDKVYEVQITNISKCGLAFKSDEKFTLDLIFSATILLWNKETFETAIKIVRIEETPDKEHIYGCQFLGITCDNEARIDVYQILNEVFE